MTQSNQLPIVFFDGFCVLCNSWVDFLLRVDRQHIFRFASLQGRVAQTLVKLSDIDTLKSIVYVDETGVYNRSTAIIRMLVRLGGIYQIAKILYIFPRPIRDAIYNLIARYRYRWFGKRDACRIATPEERDRILD